MLHKTLSFLFESDKPSGARRTSIKSVKRHNIPWLTAPQADEFDRAMREDLGITDSQSVENVGRNLAALAQAGFLDGDVRGRRVLVLCGPGNNGAGGMVAARRLHGWGATVHIGLALPSAQLLPIAATQFAILRRSPNPPSLAQFMDLDVPPDLVIDALIGRGLSGPPKASFAKLVDWVNRSGIPVLSLSVPTGIAAGTGDVLEPAIRASATMSPALPTLALMEPKARPLVGTVFLADVSVPPYLYEGPGLGALVGPLFAETELLEVV